MRPHAPPRPAQERAFLQSVVYASLFDYPVTLPQLREGLIGQHADEAALARWYDTSPLLQASIEQHAGYFFPRGRRELLETRRQREAVSRDLLEQLAGPLWLVKSMPYVRMAALSGSLAHLNADGEADLDLFVITSPGRVWSVTLTTLAVAIVMGWRKRLCLNYVVSEKAMMVGPADLFSANQIVHLRPVVGGSVYARFLDANRFVERFYPNFQSRCDRRADPGGDTRPPGMALLEFMLDWTVAPFYERVCRLLYGAHLRRRAHTWRSRDQVRLEGECLKLHTTSHRREVMERFEQALEAAVEKAEAEAATLEEWSRVRGAG